MSVVEQPFSAEIALAIDIARKHEDRVINIVGTDELPGPVETYAMMVPPRRNIDPYFVYYLNNADPFMVGHHILHELGHITRMLLVSPTERLIAGYPKECVNTAATELQNEINGFLRRSGGSPELFTTIFQTSFLTLLNNLYNFPIDIRVEQWIHDTFPGVRATQDKFLRQEIQQSKAGFNAAYIDDALPTISYRHKAMIAARASHTADLCDDKSILDPFVDTAMVRLGGELVKLILVPHDAGNRSDISAVDNWANKLSMVGWYRWV